MSKLPRTQLIGYAMGMTSVTLTNLVISQWLTKRYLPGGEQDPLVAPALFTAFFMVGRVIDAFTDPLIGYWSDRLRHRWGRRIPFVRLGLIPFALSFVLLWTPPFEAGSIGNAIYLGVLLQCYFILFTVVATPYTALIPDLSDDPRERVDITTAQAFFVMLANVAFSLMGGVIGWAGWGVMGAIIGAVVVATVFPTAFLLREHATPRTAADGEGGNPYVWVLETLRNRAFVPLIAAMAIYWFGLNLVLMAVPYWTEVVCGLPGEGEVIRVMVPFLVANLIGFAAFNVLGKRWGKYPAFLLTLGGSAVGMGSFTLVQPGEGALVWTGGAAFVTGLFVAGFMVLPFAMIADVAGMDERQTGRRREAIFYGVQGIFQKLAVGGSIFAFTRWALAGTGSAATVGSLKAVMATAGGAILVATFVFIFYPLRSRESDATPSAP